MDEEDFLMVLSGRGEETDLRSASRLWNDAEDEEREGEEDEERREDEEEGEG